MAVDSKKVNKSVNWLIGIIALLIIGGLVANLVSKKEATKIAGVNVNILPLKSGNNLITEEDVLMTIERSFGIPLPSMYIKDFDITRLEKVLRNEPFILNGDVFIDANNIVSIEITQREPILRIIDNNNQQYYLDINGKKMPLSENYTARVPIASGNINPYRVKHMMDPEAKSTLKNLLDFAVRMQNDEFLAALIDQIYVTNQGEWRMAPKLGKHKIAFGRYTMVDDKLKRLKVFYEEAIPYAGWKKYKEVDLRYKGQVVGR